MTCCKICQRELTKFDRGANFYDDGFCFGCREEAAKMDSDIKFEFYNEDTPEESDDEEIDE